MDTEEKPIEDRAKYPNRLRRKDRKLARSNRSLTSKGILVNPGENIQDAIDSIDKESGGVVTLVAGTHLVDYNITLPSFITLQGEGRDGAIINFNDADYQITITGTATARIRNSRIRDLTIEESANATAAVDILYADHFIIDNVRFSDNAGSGIRIRASQQYTVFNCLADNNVGNGYELSGAASRTHSRYNYVGCIATNNTKNGFSLTTSAGALVGNGAFVTCESDNNSDDGFDFTGTLEIATKVIGCVANNNTNHGYHCDASMVNFSGCHSDNNEGTGIYISGLNCTVTGHFADQGTNYRFDAPVAFTGNSLPIGASTNPEISFTSGTYDEAVTMVGNNGSGASTEKVVMRMKNNSGGTLDEGDVVIYDADSSNTTGNQIDTTTTGGDDRVFGMVLGTSIADGSYGWVVTEGFTDKLKVDGTTDIAIGDFLSTFTTAKIAQKASAGDMAFAIALEAYTTDDSNGVLNALLISPRKV